MSIRKISKVFRSVPTREGAGVQRYFTQSQVLSHFLQESPEVLQAAAQELVHLAVINFPVKVYQAVAEFLHAGQDFGKLRRQSADFRHHSKCIAIILGDPEAIARYKVVAQVDAGFYRNNKIIFGTGDFIPSATN